MPLAAPSMPRRLASQGSLPSRSFAGGLDHRLHPVVFFGRGDERLRNLTSEWSPRRLDMT